MKQAPVSTSPNGLDGPIDHRIPFELPSGILRALAGSLKRQWKRYRKGLKRCQEKFSERAVHDSRVETRRLLSMLELLGPFLPRGHFRKAQTLLKEHLDTFDDLRDTQVQLATVDKMLGAFPTAQPFHDYLLKCEERFARQTRKQIKGIKTRRLGKLILACRQDVKCWCADAESAKANGLLLQSMTRAFNRTVDLKNRINPKDTDTIHCTRVAFKRLRYMMETVADYLPGMNDKLLDAMRHYQTMMGDVQDAEVLRRALDRFLGKKTIPPKVAKPLRQELLARRQFLIQVFLDASDQLLDFWPEPVLPSGKRLPSPKRARRRQAAQESKAGRSSRMHKPKPA